MTNFFQIISGKITTFIAVIIIFITGVLPWSATHKNKLANTSTAILSANVSEVFSPSPSIAPISTPNIRIKNTPQPTPKGTPNQTTSPHPTFIPIKTVEPKIVTYPVELCLAPSSANRPTINFNESVSFDASCSQNLDKNPSAKFNWEFRDGDSNTFIAEEGQSVSHSFSKFARNFNSAACNNSFNRGFEVELCTTGSCLIEHYCPTDTDPVVINLKNCIKDSGGQKNIDQCIAELDL